MRSHWKTKLNDPSHTPNRRVRGRANRGHLARRGRHSYSLDMGAQEAIERDRALGSHTTTRVIVRVYEYGFYRLTLAVNHVLGVGAVSRVQLYDVFSSRERERGEIAAVVRCLDSVIGPPIEQIYQEKTRVRFSPVANFFPRLARTFPGMGEGDGFGDRR